MKGLGLLTALGMAALVGLGASAVGGEQHASVQTLGPASPDVAPVPLTAYVLVDDGVNNVVTGPYVGFDVQVDNNLSESATAATVSSSLPSGFTWSVTWSMQPCTITGAVGSQTLSCTLSLPAGSGFGVDVTSSTSGASSGPVNFSAAVDEGATLVTSAGATEMLE